MFRGVVQQTQCSPYFCNEFQESGHAICTICKQPITDFYNLEYPTPASSAFGHLQPSPRRFAVFNTDKIVPSDTSSGRLHQYAHRACMLQAGRAVSTTHDPVPFEWSEIKGKKTTQVTQVHRFMSEKMGIPKPTDYDPNATAFLMGLGDMGLLDKGRFNRQPPMATAHRIFLGKPQCMEFVHFDKFYGLSMAYDAADTPQRAPLMPNFSAVSAKQAAIQTKRKDAIKRIYPDDKIIKHYNKELKTWQMLSVLEWERIETQDFDPDHLFGQEEHHSLLDTSYRWWHHPNTFHILIDGEEVGLVELFVKDNNVVKDKLHQGKSLFVYNIIGHRSKLVLLPYVFWFAKVLALYLNRFSDMQESDSSRIRRVYLTTTSGNKAMSEHAVPSDFTKVPNGNQHWDTDYVWEIPFVPIYTQGTDEFPVHIRATLAPNTFIPNAMVCSKENVVDRSLLPTKQETAQHIASIGVSSRKKNRAVPSDNPRDANPLNQYHFHSFCGTNSTTDHKNEAESDGEIPETP